MKPDFEPHQQRIQKVGKVLWVFGWFWLIFNGIALAVVIATLGFFRFIGKAGGDPNTWINYFADQSRFPVLQRETVREILGIDFAAFMDHFWLSAFYIAIATVVFVFSMALILKIASAWKRGDIFGDSPIRSLRLLGWIYLIHGIVGQAWGIAGTFVGDSYTVDLVYFSFIRDVCLMSFATSGTGIEWGFLALTLSWILEHARLMREDQQLTV